MSYSPPPPPPVNPRQVQEKAPTVAWIIPLAGVLALIGVFTPWFDPSGSFKGQKVLQAADKLYSWKDGKIGLIAPILLVILAISVGGLLVGRSVSRFERGSAGPVVTAARAAMIAGAVALGAAVIAWFLVPSQYDNIPSDAGGSWDGAGKLGIDMTRGPQIGYWLTIAAAVIALIGGVLMLLMRTKPTPVADGSTGGQQFGSYPPPASPGGGYSAPSSPVASSYPPPPPPAG